MSEKTNRQGRVEPLSTEEREEAREIVRDILGERVPRAVWDAALKISDHFMFMSRRMINIRDVGSMLDMGLDMAGVVLVRKKELDAIMDAGREFGLAKNFATDSIKLKALKGAFQRMDLGGRLTVDWARVWDQKTVKDSVEPPVEAKE